MTTLVLGGTKGLGLELARLFRGDGDVIVAGRVYYEDIPSDIEYRSCDLSDQLEMLDFVGSLPRIDMLIVAAGYAQFSKLGDLKHEAIEDMMRVGATSPILVVGDLIARQGKLSAYLQITSTPAIVPRPAEPVYAATKAAMTHFAYSMAKGEEVSRVMVAAPSGMKSDFWKYQDNPHLDNFLEPDWVALSIYLDWSEWQKKKPEQKFRHISILRGPPRIQVERSE